jgi:hypothetical protein
MRQIWGEPGLLQQSVLSPLDEAKSMLAKKLLIGSRGVGLGPEREPQLGPTHNPISHRTTVATWPLLGAGYYLHCRSILGRTQLSTEPAPHRGI